MDSVKDAADRACEAIDYGWKATSSALVKAVKVTGEQADAAKERVKVRKTTLYNECVFCGQKGDLGCVQAEGFYHHQAFCTLCKL